jgi:hypothetical protein
VGDVVLDASRNNPLGGADTKGVGGEKGLSPHEPPGGSRSTPRAAALDQLYDGDANSKHGSPARCCQRRI